MFGADRSRLDRPAPRNSDLLNVFTMARYETYCNVFSITVNRISCFSARSRENAKTVKDNNAAKENDDTAVIAGGAAGGVILVVVIAVVATIVLKKKSKNVQAKVVPVVDSQSVDLDNDIKTETGAVEKEDGLLIEDCTSED